MVRSLYGVLVLAGLLAGCDSELDEFEEFDVLDLSRFERFTYSRSMVYDLSVGLTQQATISRMSDGAFSVALTVLQETDIVTALCERGGLDPCIREVMTPTREMTADEMTRVLTVFSGVRISQDTDAGTECGLYDPAFVATYTWDSVTTMDSPCRTPRIAHSRAAAIYELLEDLRLLN